MWPSRDSTTHRTANRRSGERKCTSFDRFAHPLGEGDRRVLRRTGQDQHELFATVPSDPVDLPRVVAEDLGELPQHLIAGLMAVRVVDALEHVEIAHHARERFIQAKRVLERLVQPFLEAPAVVDPGERVGARDAHELIVDRGQLGPLALDLLLQRLDAEEGADPGFELSEVDRLGDVVVRTRVETDDLVGCGVEGGLHDDRNERQGRIGLDAPRDLEPVDLGEHHIEQDQVGQPLSAGGPGAQRHDHGERLFAIVRDGRLVPAGLEPVPQDRHIVRIVVDDQDASRGHRAAPPATTSVVAGAGGFASAPVPFVRPRKRWTSATTARGSQGFAR